MAPVLDLLVRHDTLSAYLASAERAYQTTVPPLQAKLAEKQAQHIAAARRLAELGMLAEPEQEEEEEQLRDEVDALRAELEKMHTALGDAVRDIAGERFMVEMQIQNARAQPALAPVKLPDALPARQKTAA